MNVQNQIETVSESRDRFFDPFRSASSSQSRVAIQEVIEQLEGYEKYYGKRKRRRKSKDQAVFKETVTAVCCDLIHAYLTDPKSRVAITLSNQHLGRDSRYRSPAEGKKLPYILDIMSADEMAFLEMEKGRRTLFFEDEDGVQRIPGQRTTIYPGKKLVSRIQMFELGFGDLGRSESEEVIILKAPKNGPKDPGRWIEYEDNPEVVRYREEMATINAWICRADLSLAQAKDEPPIDIYHRRLRRTFNNGRFTEGGRLWGGFWMNLSRSKRWYDLSIAGESIAELDFGQMALRLLYGLEDAEPPEGDLYAIPGLEWARDGIKHVINSSLYSGTEQFRMPKGGRQYFPSNIPYDRIKAAIFEYHKPIAHRLFQGVGMELMFLESQIMVAVLLKMKNQGIVGLPIHDGILVPWSKRLETKQAMEAVFKDKSGVVADVRIEGDSLRVG